MTTRAGYWDEVAADMAGRGALVWRRHADTVNRMLFACWLPEKKVGRILKTDLFDEAMGEGLADLLQTHADETMGIDISPEICHAAMRRHPLLMVRQADIRCLPFDDNHFDWIISNSTLDHLKSRAEILHSLDELYRVLRPGGRLLLTLDNLANPVIMLRNVIPWSLLRRARLVPYYCGATCGPIGLNKLMRRAGFMVVERGVILHVPRAPAVVLCRIFQRYSGRAQNAALRFLGAFEKLASLPTRFQTGYYLAVHAIKIDRGDSRPC